MLYNYSDIVNNGFFLGALDVITSLSIISAVTIITLKNPIVSVLFLIMLFFFISGYLIISGGTFLGLAYLLVYIGAVSILFLFILMLINIRVSELVTDTKNSIPLVLTVAILFKYANDILLFINSLQFHNWFFGGHLGNLSNWNWEDGMRTIDHLVSIGNILYTILAILLIIVSIILILAMVGAIAITAPTESSIQISEIQFLQSNIYKNFDSKKLKKLLMKTAIMFALSISTKHIIAVYLDINVFIDYLHPVSLGYYLSIIIVKNYMDVYLWDKVTITGVLYSPQPEGEYLLFQSNSPSPNPDDVNPTGNTVVLGGTSNIGGTSSNQDTVMVDQNTAVSNQNTATPNQNTATPNQNTTMTDQGATTSNPEVSLNSRPTEDLNTSFYPFSNTPPRQISSNEEYREWLRIDGEKSIRESEEFWSKIDTTETKRGKVYKVYTEGTGNNTVKYYRNEEGLVFTRPLYKRTPFVLRGEENRELRNAYREWEKAAGFNYITPLDSRNNRLVNQSEQFGKPTTDPITIENDSSTEPEFKKSGKNTVHEHNKGYRTPAWEAGLSEEDYDYYFGEVSPPRTVPSSMGPPSISSQSATAGPSSSVHGIMGPPSYALQSSVAGPSNISGIGSDIAGPSNDLGSGSRIAGPVNSESANYPWFDSDVTQPSDNTGFPRHGKNRAYESNTSSSDPTQGTTIGPSTNPNTGSRPNSNIEDNPRPSKKPRLSKYGKNPVHGYNTGSNIRTQGTITIPSNPTHGATTRLINQVHEGVNTRPSNPTHSTTIGLINQVHGGVNAWPSNTGLGSDNRPTLPSVFGNIPGALPTNSGYVNNTSGYANDRLVGNDSGSINPSYESDPRPNHPNVFVNRPGEMGIRPNLPSIFGNRPGALFNNSRLVNFPHRAEVHPSGELGDLLGSNSTRFTSDPSRYTSTPRSHVGNPSGSNSNSVRSGRNPRALGRNLRGLGRNPGGSR